LPPSGAELAAIGAELAAIRAQRAVIGAQRAVIAVVLVVMLVLERPWLPERGRRAGDHRGMGVWSASITS
jgi:hypothetical protein